MSVVCLFVYVLFAYIVLMGFCMVSDDFSRVKISQVDLKDDDTDYINATTIDVRNNNILYMRVCMDACASVRPASIILEASHSN